MNISVIAGTTNELALHVATLQLLFEPD